MIGIAAAIFSLLTVTQAGYAQSVMDEPAELEGVEITEHLNETIPLNLEFTDDNGKDVTLQDYFDGERPVMLALVYFRCPMLCNLLLNGMIESLKEIDMTPGREFEVVAVSIDPLETPTLAKLKKQNYLKELGNAGASDGMHFLTGRKSQIEALAEATGFGYTYNEKTQEYLHKAVIFIVTPDGKLSRYLYDINFPPKTLRLSLVEASEGKIGSPVDQFILTCFQYDPDSNSYVPFAMGIMRVGGILTVLILGGTVLSYWLAEMRKRKRQELNQSYT